MISANANGQVIITIGTVTYCFDNEVEYRDLILAITDPSEAMQLKTTDLELDSEIDPKYVSICERYASTLMDYLQKRQELLSPRDAERE